MKLLHATAALALAAPALLHAQSTGVANPPAAIINSTDDDTQTAPVVRKPSAAVPAQPQPSQPVYSNQYVPYQPPAGQPSQPVASMPATTESRRGNFDPDAEVVTSVAPARDEEDMTQGVVMSVPSDPNMVPSGTLLHVRIRETLSTATTPVGTPFTAEVVAPLEHDGRVLIPIGSVLHGRVTVVRGGKRISGAAAIHLLPEYVSMPDGRHYDLHAQVIDTDQFEFTRVDREGTILRRDHPKSTLAAMGLATGGAAAAGAMMGGGVGLVVGAGIGAGASTIWWLKQDRQEVIPAHTGLVFDLSDPLPVAPR